MIRAYDAIAAAKQSEAEPDEEGMDAQNKTFLEAETIQNASRANSCIRQAALMLGSSGEWDDHESMVADFNQRVAIAAAKASEPPGAEGKIDPTQIKARARAKAFIKMDLRNSDPSGVTIPDDLWAQCVRPSEIIALIAEVERLRSARRF